MPVRSTRKRRLMGEINVVPYIDVMLVLLIIFMVTAPLLTQGVQVELPDADAKPLDPDVLRDHEPLVLSVDVAGRYYLSVGANEDKPVDEATVGQRVAAVLRRDPATPVLVRADERVPYGRVVKGMVILQQAGAKKIGFVTDPAAARALEELGRGR
jgi:biopolymer transport protein TolR